MDIRVESHDGKRFVVVTLRGGSSTKYPLREGETDEEAIRDVRQAFRLSDSRKPKGLTLNEKQDFGIPF